MKLFPGIKISVFPLVLSSCLWINSLHSLPTIHCLLPFMARHRTSLPAYCPAKWTERSKLYIHKSTGIRKVKSNSLITYHTDNAPYFYPASTVKLPIAILALQRFAWAEYTGTWQNTTMTTGEDGYRQTEVYNDPSSPDGKPTIAHYQKYCWWW